MMAISKLAVCAICLCGLGGTAAWAAGPAAPATDDAAVVYQRDRAACMSGHTGEDKNTCLKEAGAAYQAARRGGLATDGQSVYERNALSRCQLVPANERDDCRARVLGVGRTKVEGSVEGGGLLRETTTTVPVKPARP